MTYIVDIDVYELYSRDAKIFNTLLMNARVLHCTYDMGSLLFKSIFLYLC